MGHPPSAGLTVGWPQGNEAPVPCGMAFCPASPSSTKPDHLRHLWLSDVKYLTLRHTGLLQRLESSPPWIPASSGPSQHRWPWLQAISPGSLQPHFYCFLSFSCVFGVCEPPCSSLSQLPSWTLQVFCPPVVRPPVVLSVMPTQRPGGGALWSGLTREPA